MSKVQGTKNKPQVLRPVKKTVNKKALPTENISVELLKDKAVGDYLRIFLGSTSGTPTEMILHRPIGVTNLDPDDWVLSSPEELAQLKSRSKDPNYASIIAKRNQYIRDAAVTAKKLSVKDGAVFYFGHEDKKERSQFIEDLKKKHLKEHEKEKNYMFILDLALEQEEKQVLVDAEKDYRKWVKPVQKKAEELYPQTFRTMKSPLSDIPQTAIAWLKATKITEVGHMFIKHGVTGPATLPEDNGDKDDFTIDASSGATDQWFFFNSANKAKKKEVRDYLKDMRTNLGVSFKIIIND
jgi:hypothetical protein